MTGPNGVRGGSRGVELSRIVGLRRRPPQTVEGLRLIEFVVVGMTTVIAPIIGGHPVPCGYLEWAAVEPFEVREAFVGRCTLAGSPIWFVIIAIHATPRLQSWRSARSYPHRSIRVHPWFNPFGRDEPLTPECRREMED